jgi:Zn-dependent protease with chaperone function
MTDRYESMLPGLAKHAERHPRLYRAQVAALAMLGYGLLLGTLLLLIAAAVLTMVASSREDDAAAWALGVVLMGMILTLGEALWIHIPPPRGLVLKRTEAPALWAEIERIRQELRAPAPHQVLISDEMNASVEQVPRFGILGFYRTYITIGLPLAAALTPDEFRAVLAHEYGHLAGAHSRFGVWIYRVRATWTQLLEVLWERRSVTLLVFRAFVRWYAPLLEAYSTVLRRAHEFEADRIADRVAGAAANAAALCRLAVASRFLAEVFWPALSREVRDRPQAPADVFRRLLDQAPGAAAHPDASRWLAENAGQTTEPWDSHPSLTDRLTALGATPAPPAPPAAPAGPSGAHAFFGEHAAPLADRLGRRWADTMQFNWRKDHDEHVQMVQRLASLEARGGEQPLEPAEARERIQLTVQLHGATVAMPLIRDFLASGQADSGVHLVLGRAMLEQGDENGLRHLEQAMELDRGTTEEACAAAVAYLESHGRPAEAQAFHQRASAYLDVVQRASEERDPRNLNFRDTFLPHGLGEADARALSTHLSTVRGLRRALLARKQVSVMPETPCWVMVLDPVWKPGDMESGYNPSAHLGERVRKSVQLPGTLIIVEIVENGWALEKVIAAVPGAELFSRASARAGAR